MSLRIALARSRKSAEYSPTVARLGKWSKEEDSRLLKGVRQYGNEWSLIAQLCVSSRTAEREYKYLCFIHGLCPDQALSSCDKECKKRWKLRGGKRRSRPAVNTRDDHLPVVDGDPATRGATGPHLCDAKTTTQALESCSMHKRFPEGARETAREPVIEKPLAVNVSSMEVNMCMLGESGLITSLPAKTLTVFRKQEAENLAKLDRRPDEVQKGWALEHQFISGQAEEYACELDEKAVLEQVEKHVYMLEDGFSQLKGTQRVLDMLPQQPVPVIPKDKLEWLASAVGSSLYKIRTLEEALSRLQGSLDAQLRPDKHIIPLEPYSQYLVHPSGIGHTQLPYTARKPPRYHRKMHPSTFSGPSASGTSCQSLFQSYPSRSMESDCPPAQPAPGQQQPPPHRSSPSSSP
ncbi:hypothetical protein PM082_012419 [Marasmius tenuissimus]|nr:hypothetical protein PM082_012419 [Marasmius tenuissimus]